MDDRCPKTDMLKAQCGDSCCRPQTVRTMARVTRLPSKSKTFTALYWSTCPECGEKVEPGDVALYQDDDVVHEDCQTEIIPSDEPPNWSQFL